MAGVPEVIKGAFKYALAAGVLTVSAIGVTKVRFPKQGTYGDFVTLDLTGKLYTFTDGTVAGHSFLVDMFMGISDVAWANAAPWFDYLCNIDNTAANVVMGMSRNPKLSDMPAHAACDFFDALASGGEAQGNMAVWGNHAVGTGAQPCVGIGSHTMQYDKAGHDTWEVDALAATDGFGKFQDGVQFTMPVAQNGAQAGAYFEKPAANAPVFTTNEPYYKIDRSGEVRYDFYFNGDGGNDGSDATAIQLTTPYAAIATPSYFRGTAMFSGQTTISSTPRGWCQISGSDDAILFTYNSGSTTSANITHAMFTAGARNIGGQIIYQAF